MCDACSCGHILRDRRTMLIVLLMPVVQVLLLGYAIKTEIRDARLAVFDPSKDAETQRIKERFHASKYFTLAEELSEPDQITGIFKRSDISLVLVFSEHFAGDLLQGDKANIQLIVDGTDPNQASILTGYAQSILSICQAELMEQYHVPFQIQVETQMLYNPHLKSAYNFVPGVLGLVLILICAMMTSIAIVREKETGTMEILLASPMKPLHIIVAKMTPYFVISAINVVTVLLLAVFLMDVPIRGSLCWLIVASVLYVTVALALGLLISTLVNTQMNAMLVSGMALMLPILLFSGLLFPIENIPVGLRWISAFIPARWFIDAARKIMIEGAGFVYFAKDLCVIAVMAVVLMGAALRNFKIRLA